MGFEASVCLREPVLWDVVEIKREPNSFLHGDVTCSNIQARADRLKARADRLKLSHGHITEELHKHSLH